jgi:hypothetical protein
MPDHPQSTVSKPSDAFRETFLRFLERREQHDAFRIFGDLLYTLVLETPRFITSPEKRGEVPVSGTTTQHEVRAILLDLTAARSEMHGVHQTIGEGEGKEDARLALAVSDLLPVLDSLTARMQAALDAALSSQ